MTNTTSEAALRLWAYQTCFLVPPSRREIGLAQSRKYVRPAGTTYERVEEVKGRHPIIASSHGFRAKFYDYPLNWPPAQDTPTKQLIACTMGLRSFGAIHEIDGTDDDLQIARLHCTA